MKKLLITGASGFIGGFIVERALEEGYEVYAVVRKSSNLQFLTDDRINFLHLGLHDDDQLRQDLAQLKQEVGTFDYVIHNAGITKANRNQEFFSVNTDITKRFIDSLIKAGLVTKKFVFVSSLAAAGPGPDSDDTIKIDQSPAPVTSYGKSKLQAEEYLKSIDNLPYVILRPTAVFGPRDTELFALFNLLAKNLEFYIGTDRQRLSFIYVKDLVSLLFGAMESELNNKVYYISDGKSYRIKDFVAMIKQAMRKKTLRVIVPVPLVAGVAYLLEKLLGVMGRVPALNSEKMAELTSSNWTCDMEPYFNEIPVKPQYELQQAVNETVDWYKNENWI